MISYSKVETWNSCPYKYKLRYIDKLEPIPDTRPDNALFEGTAVHEGIENRSVDKAIESYKSNFTEITKDHEIEILKLKTILPRAIEQIPEGEYEYKLFDGLFVGYIDMLVKIDEGLYDLYDFKFSNNISGYKKSGQVHIYKYYYEKLTGNKIRNMYYAFIPKMKEKLDESISEQDFMKLLEKYSTKDIKFEKIEFDKQQIGWFFARKTLMERDKTFNKRYSNKCLYCEFAKYCSTNGKDKSELLNKDPVETNLWG